ncbi:Peptide chain release factor 1 [hydrothermal vent metagenome]|uniref:Peptide chain release factor 1 n=1 Tax=hydrothermal vent metagenome TaxID=652676 RepID=A0A3B1C1J8_9ZZZZ
MLSALEAVEKRFEAIHEMMGDAAVATNRNEIEKLGRELAGIRDIVTVYREYKKLKNDFDEAKSVLEQESDADLQELAREETAELAPQIEELEQKLRLMLLPKDPHDDKNIILEVRAGTGGEEAGLFSADLFRMYSRYAERQKWQVDILSASETGKGGFKEIIATITGQGAYSRLKFESGVHRVQRVPETEASGRVHTSACTVAIMPEANEVEVELDPNDLKVDVYRSSGCGGQSVNTTDSAVRITHIPTGLTVSMQDEKSQHKNRAKAMKVLLARLQDAKEAEEAQKRSAERKSQVGSGDRSERIRTYNFPQGRMSDHRINLTLYKLEALLDGELNELFDALTFASQEAALKGKLAGKADD